MTVVSSNIQQAIDALQAERAAVQQQLDWLDARIAEFAQLDAPLRPVVPEPEPEPSAPAPARRGRASRNGSRSRMSETVVAFLSDHPASTAGEIAAELGLKRNSVSTLLSKLRQQGQLVKRDRGYSLP